MITDRKVINLLAMVLYEVINHRVSIDVAFKRACKGKCASDLNEREKLYELSRKFVSDYFKLLCVTGKKDLSLKKLARIWLKGINKRLTNPACELSYSEWFYNRIKELLGDEAYVLLKTMNERHWWLRINTLLAPEEKVLKMLDNEGVEYEIDKDYPFMVKIIKSSKPIRLLRPVKEFNAIPQDKASAVVIDALKPQSGDVILDMAAAPGMKTSLIMMLTENKARIIAVDISIKRLKIMKDLLKRLGVDLSRVYLVHGDSTQFNVRHADKILLDSPCSNSGAIDKDPGIKIHLSDGKINYYSNIQRSLLMNALKLKVEQIVYSTCSIMPEEGEYVIDYVMKNSRDLTIKLVKEIKWASHGYPVVKFYGNLMRLFPHIHGTEGFFIAKIYVSQ
ncbi:MAG: hypothetical protein B6U85_00855 [Desulfurococcales archaeon ex4484_42]|nr:MAG: hypothetical protein B6U85_00855 [Desulfurococcales archaeon ex4484_42]